MGRGVWRVLGYLGPLIQCGIFGGFLNPRIPFLNKNSVLAWKYTLLEIPKSRHIEINTKLSGRNIILQNVPISFRRQDHSGVAGGFTWRVCDKLEVVSPQQVSRAGRETLT